MQPRTDAELWTSCAAGDRDAFGELFDRHSGAVYSYCFRRTADWAAAEDLTSVVFLEAWRRRRGVRLHGESALPWLLGVATNVTRNARRARARYVLALRRLPRPDPERDFADDLVGRAADEKLMRDALRALSELPLEQRDAVALCIWQGLTSAEAAVALGVPAGTVRSRLARALRRLRVDPYLTREEVACVRRP